MRLKLKPMLRGSVVLLSTLAVMVGSAAQAHLFAESLKVQGPSSSQADDKAFEVVSIKPANPDGHGKVGFYAYPSDRILIGNATVVMLIEYALNLQSFQINGGPDWMRKSRFDISALQPRVADTKSKTDLVSATPTPLQRQMILGMLKERFGLQLHRSDQIAPVYLLVLTKQSSALKQPENKNADPRGGMGINSSGVANGDAFGSNISMSAFAQTVGREIQRPVLDRTGLTGTYDFVVRASEPNEGEAMDGVVRALGSLGLSLKNGKAQVASVTIDALASPISD